MSSLKYLIVGWNTKCFWDLSLEKYFAPSRMLHLFNKYCVNTFVDNSLFSPDRLFSFFSTSTNLVLYVVTFLLIFFSLSSKSVFFLTKLAISFLLAKLSRCNLAIKRFAINLLNLGVPMYLSIVRMALTFFN